MLRFSGPTLYIDYENHDAGALLMKIMVLSARDGAGTKQCFEYYPSRSELLVETVLSIKLNKLFCFERRE